VGYHEKKWEIKNDNLRSHKINEPLCNDHSKHKEDKDQMCSNIDPWLDMCQQMCLYQTYVMSHRNIWIKQIYIVSPPFASSRQYDYKGVYYLIGVEAKESVGRIYTMLSTYQASVVCCNVTVTSTSVKECVWHVSWVTGAFTRSCQHIHSSSSKSIVYLSCNHYNSCTIKVWKWVRVMVFNATFNNISVISWQSVLLVEETRVPGENHQSASSHWSL